MTPFRDLASANGGFYRPAAIIGGGIGRGGGRR